MSTVIAIVVAAVGLVANLELRRRLSRAQREHDMEQQNRLALPAVVTSVVTVVACAIIAVLAVRALAS